LGRDRSVCWKKRDLSAEKNEICLQARERSVCWQERDMSFSRRERERERERERARARAREREKRPSPAACLRNANTAKNNSVGGRANCELCELFFN